MNAPFKQAERLGRLTTALGPDQLALLRFDGTDHLNDLFEYRIEALSPRDDLDFDALIGTHATVEIEAHDQMRPFDGIITSASWAGVGENGHRYDLVLRPWFWLAGKRRNQRIFHDKSVIEILEELLADYASLGDPAVEFNLSYPYPKLEYTVQYRETDLDFARRQMERAGISFHFKHSMGSHTLVLTDDVLAHPELGERPFKRYDGHHQYEHEHFWNWAPERNLTVGAIRQTDYNFKKPDQAMETEAIGDAEHAEGQIESFDYPGDYLDNNIGRVMTILRTAQERGADRRNRAIGDCVSLGSGMRLTLAGDKIPGTGECYLCLSATHHFVSEAYGSGGQDSDGYAFTGGYVLMPDTAPMLPPRRTPIPTMQGPQTARVVGDGEIDCDEYGRILVRFHWDLKDQYSMRCRVSQNWAGGGWGGMVIPRIGMEVLVDYLEGDPDKPVVVGNVFNGKNDTPYPLPENKTKMVIRSQTHQGEGFNEFTFEDQAGMEEVFLHGQKDHRIQIGNDQTQSIGHDRSKSVGNDQSESVGNDKTISVGNNHTETIGNDKVMTTGTNHTESIGSNKTLSVGGNHSESIAGNMSVSVEGSRSYSITGSQSSTVGASRSVSVGGSESKTVGASLSETISGGRSASAASVSTTATGNQDHSAGGVYTISAGSASITVMDGAITLSVGGSSVHLNSEGVFVDGPVIHLNQNA